MHINVKGIGENCEVLNDTTLLQVSEVIDAGVRKIYKCHY